MRRIEEEKQALLLEIEKEEREKKEKEEKEKFNFLSGPYSFELAKEKFEILSQITEDQMFDFSDQQCTREWKKAILSVLKARNGEASRNKDAGPFGGTSEVQRGFESLLYKGSNLEEIYSFLSGNGYSIVRAGQFIADSLFPMRKIGVIVREYVSSDLSSSFLIARKGENFPTFSPEFHLSFPKVYTTRSEWRKEGEKR